MRERLYQTIYDDLLRKIKTGVYAQNDKLPTEHELMGLYGVSRVTAITALNLLRDNGYIVRVPRVGSIVHSVEAEREYLRSMLSRKVAGVICYPLNGGAADPF